MGDKLGIHGGPFILNNVTPIFDITYNTDYSNLNSFSDTIFTRTNGSDINLDDSTLTNTPVANSLISLAFTDLPGTINFTDATGNGDTGASDGTRGDNFGIHGGRFILSDVTPIFDITYNTNYSDLNSLSDTIFARTNGRDINLDDNTLTDTPVANSLISLAFTELPGTLSFTDVTGNGNTGASDGAMGGNHGIHGGRFTLSDVTPIFDITYNMDYSDLNSLSDTIFTRTSGHNINLDDNTLTNTPVANSLISLAFTDLPGTISFTDAAGNGDTSASDGNRGDNLGLQAETVSLVAETTAAVASLDLALNKLPPPTAQAVTVNGAADADTDNGTAAFTLAANETNNGAGGQSTVCAACVSNLSGGTLGFYEGGPSHWIAQSFTTGGSSSDRFTLGHVIINFRSSPSSSTVQIRANNNGRPGTQIGSNLTGASLPSSGESRFNASGITLNGATSYFLTISVPNTLGLWGRSDGSDTGATGWSITDAMCKAPQGSTAPGPPTPLPCASASTPVSS